MAARAAITAGSSRAFRRSRRACSSSISTIAARGDPAAADPASYTLDENVEDMEALRRHLGLGPIVSIGTSYGGMVAMAHAARYPDAVSHLVLIVTAAHGGFIPRAAGNRARARHGGAAGGVRDAVGGGVPLGRGDAALLRGDGADVCAVARCGGRGGGRGRGRSTRRSRSIGRSGPTGSCGASTCAGSWRRITAPTLILAGRHDWICPLEFSEEIARLIPGADLRVFERSSHSIRSDEPEAMVDAILGFLVYR